MPPPVPALGRDLAEGQCVVLAIVDRFPPKVNAGAEWMLLAMLRDSVRRGHRAIVATGCTDEAYVIDGVEVFPVEHGISEGRDAEVVVSHLAWTHEAHAHAVERSLPVLYVVHNEAQVKFWRLDRDKVSALVWNSEWLAADGRGAPDVAGIPSTVVRPPLVVGDYAVDSSREFVTLINPIAAKGAGIFYDLARAERQRRFLAVEGAYGSQVRPGAQESNVTWQRQTGNIAADVYARTRVLLMPSTAESWGRAAVEALCSGIPVIASPTPGLLEALGDAGMFVRSRDPRAWLKALRLLDDPDVYDAWSSAGRERAAELEALADLDLERWNVLVRLAAGTTRLRSGRMTTLKHDPYRTTKSTPEPDAAVEAQEPVPVPTPTEAPAGPENDVRPVWEVPSRASDIVVALRQTVDQEEQRARARAVLAAEDARGGKRRASVDAEVARVLTSA